MVQLATQRTALFLYTVLVLLPALVFGGLLWHQLTRDHAKQLEAIPRNVRGAAARLMGVIEQRVDELLAEENARRFYHYNQDYLEPSTILEDGQPNMAFLPSPMITEQAPPGILGWFSWDFDAGPDLEPLVITGRLPEAPPGASDEERAEIAARQVQRRLALQEFVTEKLIREQFHEGFHFYLEDFDIRRREMELAAPMDIYVLALNLNSQRDPACMRADLKLLRQNIRGLGSLSVTQSPLELRALRDGEGKLRVVALRKVLIEQLPPNLRAPACFENLEHENIRVQGFEIDSRWLLHDLPVAQAEQVLGSTMRFVPPGADVQGDESSFVEDLDIFEELDVRVYDPADRGLALGHVIASGREMQQAFRVQIAWLVGVAAVMVASLTIGIRLLLGSVRASQEQARRTENFVAAVTHELRTPLATVKMYGEMLHEGWTRDEHQRAEYISHIVNETDRLNGLVDRILEKRRLAGETPPPTPGDLNLVVSNLVGDLRHGGREDLEFDLERGLPPVLLVEEAVRDVLVNLVENARKYAPQNGSNHEPTRVVTRLDRRGRVVLEVLDRGPGIPEAERSRVFDAFYRIGDEKTRQTSGTGLGLHLVQLQARSMKGRVQALPRPGGGTIFRVTFRTLKPGTVA